MEECCPNYWDSHSIMKKKKKTQKLTDVECLVCTVPMTERYNYIYIVPPVVECCSNYWDSHSMKKKKKTEKLTDVEYLVCAMPMISILKKKKLKQTKQQNFCVCVFYR